MASDYYTSFCNQPKVLAKIVKMLDELQEYGHSVVWVYGETKATIDGTPIDFQLGRVFMGAPDRRVEAPLEAGLVEQALKLLR